MQARAQRLNLTDCPKPVSAFVNVGQIFLTNNQLYDVHAISLFSGVLMLLVIDDNRSPSWEPAWLFEIADKSLPADWICSTFTDEPAMVTGPEFIAKDHAGYSRMVELDSDQVDRFWRHVDGMAVI